MDGSPDSTSCIYFNGHESANSKKGATKVSFDQFLRSLLRCAYHDECQDCSRIVFRLNRTWSLGETGAILYCIENDFSCSLRMAATCVPKPGSGGVGGPK